jgi:hypothetical protein
MSSYQGKYSLYYDLRDGKAGEKDIGNFDRAIQLSRSALVVLSRHLGRHNYNDCLVTTCCQMQAEGELECVKILKVRGMRYSGR